MKIRLQKAITAAGVTSRRTAESLIRLGCVTVNGKAVTDPKADVDPQQDHIRVNGRPLPRKAPLTYLLMYKPKGVVSTLHDPQGRITVRDLLKRVKVRVFPVGRLDLQSEGLLLLTNDGEMANRLLHPRYGVSRVYRAKVKGIPDERDLERIRRGVPLEPGARAKAKVKIYRVLKSNAWIEISLTEGRNREVRRLCEAVGHPVIALKRVRFGPLNLKGLRPGDVRPLSEEEIQMLRHACRWKGWKGR